MAISVARPFQVTFKQTLLRPLRRSRHFRPRPSFLQYQLASYSMDRPFFPDRGPPGHQSRGPAESIPLKLLPAGVGCRCGLLPHVMCTHQLPKAGIPTHSHARETIVQTLSCDGGMAWPSDFGAAFRISDSYGKTTAEFGAGRTADRGELVALNKNLQNVPYS